MRTKKLLAVVAVAAVPLAMTACDDDDDGNIDSPDIEAPDTLPDLDPGEGTGLPGDEDDEDDDG